MMFDDYNYRVLNEHVFNAVRSTIQTEEDDKDNINKESGSSNDDVENVDIDDINDQAK
jgi:hypothetical protein